MSNDKKKFYAVAVGRKTGVFDTWEECQAQVSGFSGAQFKSFPTLQEAQQFVSGKLGSFPENDGASCSASKKNTSFVTAGVKRPLSSVGDSDLVRAAKCSDEGNSVEELQAISSEWIEARRREAVVVYIDGACKNNGKRNGTQLPRAGFGGFYGDGDSRNFKFPLPAHEPQTNQRAELSALIHVLRTAVDDRFGYNLCVYSDSKYTVMGANSYSHRWKRNGFKTAGGGNVANVDLWNRFIELRDKHQSRCAERLAREFRLKVSLATLAARAVALQLKHVPGHKGVYGNEMADRLAVEACEGSHS